MKVKDNSIQSFEELLVIIQRRYPGAYLKEGSCSSSVIVVPYRGMKMLVQDYDQRSKTFTIDFVLPVLWMLITLLGCITAVTVLYTSKYDRTMYAVAGLLAILLSAVLTRWAYHLIYYRRQEAFRRELAQAISYDADTCRLLAHCREPFI